MKKSVGFVAMMKRPNEDGNTSLMAVLSRRGYVNEKGEPESYPGCHQVTCHGGLEEVDGGDFHKAIVREAEEELGRTFSDWLKYDILLAVVNRLQTEDKLVVTFGALVPRAVLSYIYLPSNTGGLLRVTAEEFERRVTPITKEMRKSGPPDMESIAMFPDEIEAVRKAFKYFSI